MQLSDGSLNSLLSITVQTLDCILLLLLRPFNDNQVTIQEALGGLTNTAAYFALGLPAVLGPTFALDDITVLLLSMFGVVISAVSSALAQVSAALSGILACLACAGLLGPASIPANDIVAEAGQSALESAQAAIEREQRETVSAPLEACAVGLAYGIGKSVLAAQVNLNDASKDAVTSSVNAEEKWQRDSVREWCTAMPAYCAQHQAWQRLSFEAWCTASPRAARGQFDWPVLLSSPRLFTGVQANQATRGCDDLYRMLDCNANVRHKGMGIAKDGGTHPNILTSRAVPTDKIRRADPTDQAQLSAGQADPTDQIQLSARADLVYFSPAALSVSLTNQTDSPPPPSPLPVSSPMEIPTIPSKEKSSWRAVVLSNDASAGAHTFHIPKKASKFRAAIQRPLSSAFHDDLAHETIEDNEEAFATHRGDNDGAAAEAAGQRAAASEKHADALRDAGRCRSTSVGTPRSAARHPEMSPYPAALHSPGLAGDSALKPPSRACELDESVPSQVSVHEVEAAASTTPRSTALGARKSVKVDLTRQESIVAPPSRRFHYC